MRIRDRVQLILDEIEGVAAQYGVNSWEKNFLDSIQTRAILTMKQEEKLIEIEHKVFGDSSRTP